MNSFSALLEEKFLRLFISNFGIPIFVIVALNLEAKRNHITIPSSRFITDAGFSPERSIPPCRNIHLPRILITYIAKFAEWYCLLDDIPQKRSWNSGRTHFWRRFIIRMTPVPQTPLIHI
ncbi:hypothetical protein CDAR_495631 [Caerostris darwini]|uniref:Uncharacterized protein n=1 Tax=Caerostris darwini TaxID=1538125 RepID=A0AAV4SDQ6_9ARAC|nr:hypothetical protein CDAR_495631 [Caerostris darwini]